jgi:hypothetical protein
MRTKNKFDQKRLEYIQNAKLHRNVKSSLGHRIICGQICVRFMHTVRGTYRMFKIAEGVQVNVILRIL